VGAKKFVFYGTERHFREIRDFLVAETGEMAQQHEFAILGPETVDDLT
jgi:hypothetical protein